MLASTGKIFQSERRPPDLPTHLEYGVEKGSNPWQVGARVLTLKIQGARHPRRERATAGEATEEGRLLRRSV